jgi:hypothetical protein
VSLHQYKVRRRFVQQLLTYYNGPKKKKKSSSSSMARKGRSRPLLSLAAGCEWRRDGGHGAARGDLTRPGSAFHSTGPLIADMSPLLTDIPGPT